MGDQLTQSVAVRLRPVTAPLLLERCKVERHDPLVLLQGVDEIAIGLGVAEHAGHIGKGQILRQGAVIQAPAPAILVELFDQLSDRRQHTD